MYSNHRGPLQPHWLKERGEPTSSLQDHSSDHKNIVSQLEFLGDDPTVPNLGRRMVLRAGGLAATAFVTAAFDNRTGVIRSILQGAGDEINHARIKIAILALERMGIEAKTIGTELTLEALDQAIKYAKSIPSHFYAKAPPDGDRNLELFLVGEVADLETPDIMSNTLPARQVQLGIKDIETGRKDLGQGTGDFTEKVLQVALRRFPEVLDADKNNKDRVDIAHNASGPNYWMEKLDPYLPSSLVTEPYDYLSFRFSMQQYLAGQLPDSALETYHLASGGVSYRDRKPQAISEVLQVFSKEPDQYEMNGNRQCVLGLGFIAYLGKYYIQGKHYIQVKDHFREQMQLIFGELNHSQEFIDNMEAFMRDAVFEPNQNKRKAAKPPHPRE